MNAEHTKKCYDLLYSVPVSLRYRDSVEEKQKIILWKVLKSLNADLNLNENSVRSMDLAKK